MKIKFKNPGILPSVDDFRRRAIVTKQKPEHRPQVLRVTSDKTRNRRRESPVTSETEIELAPETLPLTFLESFGPGMRFEGSGDFFAFPLLMCLVQMNDGQKSGTSKSPENFESNFHSISHVFQLN